MADDRVGYTGRTKLFWGHIHVGARGLVVSGFAPRRHGTLVVSQTRGRVPQLFSTLFDGIPINPIRLLYSALNDLAGGEKRPCGVMQVFISRQANTALLI